jgi:hypothetical protein
VIPGGRTFRAGSVSEHAPTLLVEHLKASRLRHIGCGIQTIRQRRRLGHRVGHELLERTDVAGHLPSERCRRHLGRLAQVGDLTRDAFDQLLQMLAAFTECRAIACYLAAPLVDAGTFALQLVFDRTEVRCDRLLECVRRQPEGGQPIGHGGRQLHGLESVVVRRVREGLCLKGLLLQLRLERLQMSGRGVLEGGGRATKSGELMTHGIGQILDIELGELR